MPDDGSGNYTLPAVYQVTPGTTIFDYQVETPFEDIAQALSQRMPINGTKAMTGDITFVSGKTAILGKAGSGNEAIRYNQITDTAWYLIGSTSLQTFRDRLGVALSLASRSRITTTALADIAVGDTIELRGFNLPGDAPPFQMIRLAAAPAPVRAWHSQSSDGAWFEIVFAGVAFVEWFGLITGASVAVQTAAVIAARDFIYAKTTATEGARGLLTCCPGRIMSTNAEFAFNTPINIVFWPAAVLEQRTNGCTFSFGNVATTAGQNTQYDVRIQTVIAVAQNTGDPVSINGTGGTGVRWRNAQFSRFEFGTVRQYSFTNYEFDCDGGDIASPDRQHVQQNTIMLGQVAYGGYGVRAVSKSALEAAFQANTITWQDFVKNITHIDISEVGGSLPADTSVNVWRGTLEKQVGYPAGLGVSLQGSYNEFDFNFAECTIVQQAGSVANKIKAKNPATTGIVYADNSGNDTNFVEFGEPEPGQINGTIGTPADNTFVPNNYGVAISVGVDVTINNVAGQSATVEFVVRGPAGVERIVDVFVASGSAMTNRVMMKGRVPAYWQWKVRRTVTGASTTTYNSAIAMRG